MRYLLLTTICVLTIGAIVSAFLFWESPESKLQIVSSATKPHLESNAKTDESAPIHFSDLAKAAGIDFVHVDGRTPMSYFPEVTGGGVAWLDYDQDGFIDLFLVQSGPFPPDNGPSSPPRGERPTGPSSRLYRNLGDGTFMDVTERVGIRHAAYGQGVAVGDYDNDGFPDLFVSCFGGGYLFHNEPD